jgi:hypothetical protein
MVFFFLDMLQDLCKSFQRGFLRDSIHSRADFLLFLCPKSLLIGHNNEQHYRGIQRKLQPKVEFDYTEKDGALELINNHKPQMVIVDSIAHYLFSGHSVPELLEWIHELQKTILSVLSIDIVWWKYSNPLSS